MEHAQGLGHFQVGSYRYRSLTGGLDYGSLIEALNILNSPPVVSFNKVAPYFDLNLTGLEEGSCNFLTGRLPVHRQAMPQKTLNPTRATPCT